MKIYFILNSITDAHSVKRVTDFKNIGIDIRVFGFLRSNEKQDCGNATIIGNFSNTLSYPKRLKIYYQGIKKLFKDNSGENILWFYLGFDVALIATFIDRKKKYIYEECDLVHTRIKNKTLFDLFERIDKKVIKNAFKTILTSEGFLDFHYGEERRNIPDNIILVENKLDESITQYPAVNKGASSPNHIRFAFAGSIRYSSLLNIAEVIARRFPQHEFHFYGYVTAKFKEIDLPHRNNIFYHGRYKSPIDLPKIYQETDIMVATYDNSNINVRYAEPNKLYEAIFFNCPILVSRGTFLAKKVNRLDIGFDVDAQNEDDIVRTVNRIETEINSKILNIKSLDKKVALSNNSYVKEILESYK